MKQDTTKKRNWLLPAIILMCVVMLMLIVGLKKEPVQEVPETEPAETVVETTEAVTVPEEVPEITASRGYEIVELVNGQVQTPYGALNYPEELADHLLIANTSQRPYTLEFYAIMEAKHEVRLFDISLGEGSGGNMGIVTTPAGEKVPLNVTIYTVNTDESWTEGEIITLYAMQEVINDMIDQMGPKPQGDAKTEEPEVVQQPEENDTIHNLEIETPYVTLYYPAKWSNTLTYTHDDVQEDVYKVHFYSQIPGRDNQHLFSIYLGGDEGEQIGAIMTEEGMIVTVNLLLSDLSLEGWSEEDVETVYSMQEAVNQLLDKLPLLD